MANLFSSQTPTLGDVNEAAPVTVSTLLVFAQAGTVTGGRFYAPATVGAGTYALVFYRVDTDDVPATTGTGTLLATSANYGTVTASAWNSISFTSTAVSTGVAYRIGLRSSAGRYTATGAGFLSSGLTNGNITAPQTETDPVGIGLLFNGAFIENITSFPNKTFNGNMYFVDVDFTPAGDSTPPSVPGNLITTAIGATSVSLSWDASTDNVGVTGYEIQIIGQ